MYCVSSEYTRRRGLRKIGYTNDPLSRMRVYNTGDAPVVELEKQYEAIWQVRGGDERALEHQVHTAFSTQRRRRSNGNLTEWFEVSLEQLREYMSQQTFVMREITLEEIQGIHRAAREVDLQDEFFHHMMPGSAPPRVQIELWNAFQEICESSATYRGIVQWATGVGKTVGMMILLFLSHMSYVKKGKVFRGLIVSPRNDIFDTILHHINKLSKWGIVLYHGHNAQIKSLNDIPTDKAVLITITHASLSNPEVWEKLPPITHFHYDEVHRITGTEFFSNLERKLKEWGTQFLTGTSATPLTCSTKQNEKVTELFGSSPTLHKCNVDEAIAEGWIARPRFGVHVLPQDIPYTEILEGFVQIIDSSINNKKDRGLWRGGKVIAYLSRQEDVRRAVSIAMQVGDAVIYSAVPGADALSDSEFVQAPANGTSRVLFACDRYREGADISGVEMTCVLMGETIGANVLLQITGRALRNDYPDKEGWCIMVQPNSRTEEEVMESVVLSIIDFLGKNYQNGAGAFQSDKIRPIVERFFGEISVNGRLFDIEETIERVQCMYERNAFLCAGRKEKYSVIQKINRSMRLTSKKEYNARSREHRKYVENPPVYFQDEWVSWMHFLGAEVDHFPPTLEDWKAEVIDRDIASWRQYKNEYDQAAKKKLYDLPRNPGEMYEEYTNWGDVFSTN